MHVDWVSETPSTNTELVGRAASGTLESLSALVTTNQTAGRGRLGRTWVAPPGSALAVSVFVRADRGLGWLPLLAGLAMTRAVRTLLPGEPVSLKWPNDVLVGSAKVSGLLGEIVAGGAVMGAGVNLTMTEDQLPVPTASSLTLLGAEPDGLVDRALAAYLSEFERLWLDFEAADFDPQAGLRSAVCGACGTLGRTVRVELPSGGSMRGVAENIDLEGRLVVMVDGTRQVVAAGDVTHLRLEWP